MKICSRWVSEFLLSYSLPLEGILFLTSLLIDGSADNKIPIGFLQISVAAIQKKGESNTKDTSWLCSLIYKFICKRKHKRRKETSVEVPCKDLHSVGDKKALFIRYLKKRVCIRRLYKMLCRLVGLLVSFYFFPTVSFFL